MSESEKEVRTYLVNYECDSCHSGTMKKTGESRQIGFETLHQHKCSFCGNLQQFPIQYPKVRYEDRYE